MSSNSVEKKKVSLVIALAATIVTSFLVGPSIYSNAQMMIASSLTSSATPSSGLAVNQEGAPDTSSGPPSSVPAPDQRGGSTTKPAEVSPSSPTLRLKATFANSDFTQCGVGLRNVGSGELLCHYPAHTVSVKAFLYWTILDSGTATAPDNADDGVIYFNGERIVGTLIASGSSPCWAPPNIYVFSADVSGNMVRRAGPLDSQYVSVRSGVVDGSNIYSASSSQMAESAHLILIFKSAATTGSNVRIFEASGFPGSITFIGGPAAFTAPFAAPHIAGTPASFGHALADGQNFGVPNSKLVQWSDGLTTTTVATGEIYGEDPSITSQAPRTGSLSDTQQYDVTPNTGNSTAATITWDFNSAGPNPIRDCVSFVAVTVQG